MGSDIILDLNFHGTGQCYLQIGLLSPLSTWSYYLITMVHTVLERIPYDLSLWTNSHGVGEAQSIYHIRPKLIDLIPLRGWISFLIQVIDFLKKPGT